MSCFMKNFSVVLLVAALLFGESMAQTDTVYIRKHVTDTIYVKSPPDTVYIQKSMVRPLSGITKPVVEENEFVTYYDTDTIPPATNFYISGMFAANMILPALGGFILSFDVERENEYRGSLIYNYSMMIEFSDPIKKEWEGFKGVWGPGVGYRHYLGSIITTHANPKKKVVKHRNVPLSSVSFYVQAMTGPTIKHINIRNLENERQKKTSWNFGGFVKGSLGYVWNSGNFLWGMELSGGYQYWGKNADKSMSTEKLILTHGTPEKGANFGYDLKLGF